jgi:hypothetical protein
VDKKCAVLQTEIALGTIPLWFAYPPTRGCVRQPELAARTLRYSLEAVMQDSRNGSNGSNGANGGSLLHHDPHVQEVVKTAHEELRQLMKQRADIMKRIGTLKQTISGLANLFGDEILGEDLLELVDRKTGGRQPGFTKACRLVLMESGRPLSVREVCQQIQDRMPAVLLRHKDPLASVTTVLNRLVDYGEAQSEVRENGRRAWQWVSEPPHSSFGSVPAQAQSVSEL